MNKVILIGRLTKDPEVRNTANQATVCRFTVAVDRKFKDANGQRQADFINCVAWRQTANFISSYFHKGSKIAIVGNIQTRNYEANGQKHYVTEVVVDEAEFVDSANSGNNGGNTASRPNNGGYGNNNYGGGSYNGNSGNNYPRNTAYPDAPFEGPAPSAAPAAPTRQITPDPSEEAFQGSDDELNLPFPIDDDTGNISF